MKVMRNFENLRGIYKNCLLTIGNFDGMHRGHQSLLLQICNEKKKNGGTTIVILFEPHPVEFLRPEKAPLRIMSFRDKINYLSKWNIDFVFCISFDKEFSSISASYFLIHLILKNIDVKYIAVGKDFRFGVKKSGDVELLKNIGRLCKFFVFSQEDICINGERISSSLIRDKLTKNEFLTAKNLLGHDFYISGKVRHGRKKGRILGFPTANIFLHRYGLSISGVYVVKVIVPCLSMSAFGVANIGRNPTFYGKKKQLEVHILNMNIDLYRKFIYVVLYKKIRNEKYFCNINDLISEIKKDVRMAENYFKI